MAQKKPLYQICRRVAVELHPEDAAKLDRAVETARELEPMATMSSVIRTLIRQLP